jgi:hypothetical protein
VREPPALARKMRGWSGKMVAEWKRRRMALE